MAVTTEDLMKKARSLSTSTCEVDLRLSIRCAYYFSYHRLLEPICHMYNPSKAPAHREMAGLLKDVRASTIHRKAAMNCGGEAQIASKKYKALKIERERADYDLNSDVSPELVALQLERMAEMNTISIRLRTALGIAL